MQSHPAWVRGLKQFNKGSEMNNIVSHPAWVRGLKLSLLSSCNILVVAPRVGAWIETKLMDIIN